MADECELCTPHEIIFEDKYAYVCMDADPQGPGHVIVAPKRHVESFFDMEFAEKTSVLPCLMCSKDDIDKNLSPTAIILASILVKRPGKLQSTSISI